MIHVNNKTGKQFDVSRLIDFDSRTHDINIITKWDYENDFEQSPVIIDYYFGDYEKEDTDYYINSFLETQENIKAAINYLEKLALTTDTAELKKVIELLKQLHVEVV